MSSGATSLEEQNAKYLQRFLAWVTPPAFAFAVLFGGIYLLDHTLWMGVLALAALANGCMFLAARQYISRGGFKQAVALICASLLAIDILAAAIEPVSLLGLVIVPLLVAAVALPYLSGRWLYWMLCLCWLTAALIALLSEITSEPIIEPPQLGFLMRVLLITVPVSAVLLLLWQFSSRLNRTLAEMQAANAALRESELRYRSITEIAADVI
jgi:hypothetical protein